jgi:DNA-binding beta-propeller fold protein YncE
VHVHAARLSPVPRSNAQRARAGPATRSPVGTYSYPTSIILAPGGSTAVVLGPYDGTVRLLNTRTRTAAKPVKVGALPVAVAVTH